MFQTKHHRLSDSSMINIIDSISDIDDIFNRAMREPAYCQYGKTILINYEKFDVDPLVFIY